MAKLLSGTRIYGTGTVDNQLFVNGTIESDSTDTGALVVAGGLGVRKNLWVGGTIYGIITSATNVLGGVVNTLSAGTDTAVTTSTGQVIVYSTATLDSITGRNPNLANALHITNTTDAAGTDSGALTVVGGVGIGGNLYVGGNAFAGGAQIVTSATINQFANQTSLTAGTDTAVSTSTGNITIWNTSNLQSVTDRGFTTTNKINVSNTSASFSTITGALTVAGGAGIQKNLYVGGTVVAQGYDLMSYDGSVHYVSDSIGSDTNDGHRLVSSFKTIKYALSQAQSGDKIFIEAGTYYEDFPLTIPQGVSVKGAGLRSVTVYPTTATNTQTAFLLNGECCITDFTVTGFYKPGYAFKFAPGAKITTRSPYVERFSVITRGTNVTSSDPYGYDSGNAGNGAYIDASVLDPTSLEPAMLWNEATFIVPNATGFYMTNGARAELLNGFVYFASKAIHAVSGTTGYGGVGKTRLKVSGVTGNFVTGDTIIYKSPAGTVLASGTISSTASGYIYLDGPVWGFKTAVDASTSTQNVYSTGASPSSATSIILADYHQFGAELRCIGSAAVFGDQGVIANGTGTDLKLIAFNLSAIGSGKDLSDDFSLTVQSNEIIQLNDGKIYYQTVDQYGDFRVGDHFLVNQRTGDVSFNSATINLSNLSSLVISDGVNSTTLTPGNIVVGSLNFAGNTISSQSGNITIDPAGSLTTINSNLQVNGSANIAQLSYILGAEIVTTATIGNAFGGGQQISGTVNITNTGSNAFVVAGGAIIGGNLVIGGNVQFNGTVTSINSNAVDIGSKIIYLSTLSNTALQAIGSGFIVGTNPLTSTNTNTWASLTFDGGTPGNWQSTNGIVPLTTGLNLGLVGTPWNSLYINSITSLLSDYNTSTVSGNSLQFVNGGAGVKYLYVDAEAWLAGSRILNVSTLSNYAVTNLVAGTDTVVTNNIGTSTVYVTSTLQSVTGRGATTNRVITITTATQSYSTDTGALQVTGGVGIGGNVYTAGVVTVDNGTDSGGTNAGALIVTGGAGIGGKLNVGGQSSITVNSPLNYPSIYHSLKLDNFGGTTSALLLSNTSNKNVVVANHNGLLKLIVDGYETLTMSNTVTTITRTTEAVSTTTGALVVAGGVGIGGALYAGGPIYSNGNQVLTSGGAGGGGYVASLLAGTDTAVNTSTGVVTVWNTSTLQSVTGRGATTNNAISITNTTNSVNTVTGALIVSGGVGIGGSIYIANTSYIGTSTILTSRDLETVTFTATYITNDPTSQTGLAAIANTTTVYGTYNFGTVSDVGTINDYNTGTNTGFYSINDATGAPAYIVYIGFSNVTDFTRLVLNLNYTAASGHTVEIDLYNYVTLTWDTLTTYSGSTNWFQFILSVIDSAPYLSSGKVSARIYHVSPGSTTHRTWIDYAALENSVQGGQGPRGATGATGPSGPQGLTTTTSSTFIFSNLTNSTSTNSGAVVVSGGVGIGGNLYVGGSAYVSGNQVVTTATINNYANQTVIFAGTDTAINTSTGNITIWNTSTLQSVTDRGATTNNAISITNTTNALATNSGALTVAGGIGVGQDLRASALYDAGNRVVTSVVPTGVNAIGIGGLVSNGTQTSFSIINLGTTSTQGSTYIGVSANTGTVTITNLGVQTLTAGTDTRVSGNTGTITVWDESTLQSVTGRGSTTNNAVTITNATASTTTVSANALYVQGGVGIGSSLYVTGKAVFTDNVTFTGATTYVYSTNTVYTDNIIELHTPSNSSTWSVNDGKDIGLRFHYYNSQDDNAFLGRANDTGYLEWYGAGAESATGTFVGASYGTIKTGQLILTSATASTSTTSGALQVAGGVGIQGDLWVGGLLHASVSGSITTATNLAGGGPGQIPFQLNTGTTAFSSSLTYVNGTLTLVGSLYATALYDTNARVITTSTIANYAVTSLSAGTDTAVTTSVGAVTVYSTATFQSLTNRGGTTNNAISITNNTASTGTSYGALTVAGGVGIGGMLYATGVYGNGVYDNNNRVVTSVVPSGTTYIGIGSLVSAGTQTSFTINNLGVTTVNGSTYIGVTANTGSVTFTNLGVQTLTAGTDTRVSSSTGTVTIWDESTLQSVTGRGATTNNAINITNSTVASTTATGALIVAGGLGVGGSVYAGPIYDNYNRVVTRVTAVGSTYIGIANLTSNGTATSFTINNLGVNYINGSTYIGVDANTGTINLTNLGVQTLTAGTDTRVSSNTGTVTVWDVSTLQSVTGRGASTNVQTTFNNGLILGSTANNPLYFNGTYSNPNGTFIVASGGTSTPSNPVVNFFDGQYTLTPSTSTVTIYYGKSIIPVLNNTVAYTNMYGQYSRIDFGASAAGSVANWYGFISANPTKNAAATTIISNHVGFLAQDPNNIVSTNVTGYQSQISAGTGKYNIYASGSAQNYFAGNVGIGVGSPLYPLDVSGGARLTGILTVTNVTSATSTVTGAVQITGGAGIRGDLWVGGVIYGNIAASVSSATTILVTNDVASTTTHYVTFVANTGSYQSIKTDGPSGLTFIPSSGFHGIGTATPVTNLEVVGGVKISGLTTVTNSLYANALYDNSNRVVTSVTPTGVNAIGIGSLTSTGPSVSFSIINLGTTSTQGSTYIGVSANTGTVTITNLGVQTLTAGPGLSASSSTGTVTMTNTGVLSAIGTTYIGVSNTTGNVTFTNLGVTSITTGSGIIVSSATGTVNITNIDTLQLVTNRGATTNNAISITNATASTSSTTGALVVTGGVGIGGDLYVNGGITANQLTIQYTTVTTTFVKTDDIISTYNTTNATSTNTGALQIAGGVGIGRDVVIGGNLGVGTAPTNANGVLQVNGTLGLAPNSLVRQWTNGDGGTLKFYGTQFVAGQQNSGSYGYTGGAGLASVSPSGTYVTLDVGGQTTGNSHRLKVINDGTGITGYLYYGQEGGTTATLYANVATNKVGIGTMTPAYALEVNGSFAATTKSFVIDHPTRPGMRLRYGSLEGPENGVYVRGKLTGTDTIELPDYWTKLVDPNSITVDITPLGKHQKLFVKEIADNKVVIGNDNLFSKDINCFYTVWAERCDVEKLETEIQK